MDLDRLIMFIVGWIVIVVVPLLIIRWRRKP
jgi:hypothetical protein